MQWLEYYTYSYSTIESSSTRSKCIKTSFNADVIAIVINYFCNVLHSYSSYLFYTSIKNEIDHFKIFGITCHFKYLNIFL